MRVASAGIARGAQHRVHKLRGKLRITRQGALNKCAKSFP
jgi:hypothetical protein